MSAWNESAAAGGHNNWQSNLEEGDPNSQNGWTGNAGNAYESYGGGVHPFYYPPHPQYPVLPYGAAMPPYNPWMMHPHGGPPTMHAPYPYDDDDEYKDIPIYGGEDPYAHQVPTGRDMEDMSDGQFSRKSAPDEIESSHKGRSKPWLRRMFNGITHRQQAADNRIPKSRLLDTEDEIAGASTNHETDDVSIAGTDGTLSETLQDRRVHIHNKARPNLVKKWFRRKKRKESATTVPS
jgi:hypothetical protein